MRAFAMTGIETASMICSMRSGSLMRATPPWARMSAGTRSSAMTATAPASSAIFACSAVTTSMITPPLSISARPRFTLLVPKEPLPWFCVLSVTSVSPILESLRAVRARTPALAAPGEALFYARPGGGEAGPHIAEQLRQRLGARDDREEVRVGRPSGHHVLVQVVGDARSGDPPLVHADVEAVGPGRVPEDPHRRLGEARDLVDLGLARLVVQGHVPVRTDEQVPGVVREEVHQHVGVLAAGDDERLLIRARRRDAEGAAVGPSPGLDVDHAVRRPEPLVIVRDTDEVARRLHVLPGELVR